MEQIGIVMILAGLAGMLGATGKMIYEEFGINDSMLAVCWMLVIIGMVLALIAAGR